jgi:hypothetical protein
MSEAAKVRSAASQTGTNQEGVSFSGIGGMIAQGVFARKAARASG